MRKGVNLFFFALVGVLWPLGAHTVAKQRSSLCDYAQASWSRIDPTSLTQYLAFLRLYPTCPESQQALQRLEQLIGIEPELISQLQSDLGRQCVTILSGNHGRVDLMSEQLLAWIDKAALINLKQPPIGRSLQTIDQLIQVPQIEFDVAQSAFICASVHGQLPQTLLWRQLHAKLDLLALCAQAPVKGKIFQSVAQRDKALIESLNHVVFIEQGFAFPSMLDHQAQIDQYTSLPSLLSSKKGVCLGVSILYLALAQRLGLELSLITPPGHIYLRYESPAFCRNIETTAGGMHLRDELYRPLEGALWIKRELKELPGLIFINDAAAALGKGEFKKAYQSYVFALKFLNSDSNFYIRELKAYTLYQLDVVQGSKQIRALWHEYTNALSNRRIRLIFDAMLLEQMAKEPLPQSLVAYYFSNHKDDLQSLLQQDQFWQNQSLQYAKSKWVSFQRALNLWRLGRLYLAYKLWPIQGGHEPRYEFALAQIAQEVGDWVQVRASLARLEQMLDREDLKPSTPYFFLKAHLCESIFSQ